jgi:hypothetical protein
VVDELAGPLSYSAGWVWLLVGLALLPAFFWFARRVGPDLTAWLLNRRPRLSGSERCLALIADIEARHAAGTLGGRAAHLELSRAVRDYSMTRSGERIDTMTLHDLSEHTGTVDAGFAELIVAMQAFYAGGFHDRPTTNLGAAAEHARTAVRACS